MRLVRFFLLSLISTAVLFTSVASANRLSVSNRNIRIVWSPLEFGSGGLFLLRCSLTLEGSFHSATIAKVRGVVTGFISRANITRPCSGGNMWTHNGAERLERTVLPQSLPWHITYETFEGRLPTIEAVRILFRRIRFSLEIPILSCLGNYGAASDNPTARAVLNAAGQVTALSVNGSITRFTRTEGSANCPAILEFQGNATLTLLSTTTAIIIRLI